MFDVISFIPRAVVQGIPLLCICVAVYVLPMILSGFKNGQEK